MKYSDAVFSLLFLITNISFAQISDKDSLKENTGFVYGKDHAFSITAPKGWLLDNSSAVSQGIHAVFYPLGGSWENSKTVMYVNTASKSVEGNETIQSLISYDSLNFLKNFNDTEIKCLPNLFTGDRKEAKVLSYFYSNYEIVAYIDEPKIVAMIIMTSRDHKDYNESLLAFNELVGSYFFISSDVNFDK